MKTRFFSLALFFLVISSAKAQINFGAKGGLNFNASELSTSGGSIDSKDNSGYHAGVWMRVKIPAIGLYVRPEIIYTSLTSEYTVPVINQSASFELNKIDLPVLIGMKFIGVGNFFIGPSFQYVLSSKFNVGENSIEQTITPEDFNMGLQVGLGIAFWKIGVDLRYETAIQKAEAAFGNDLQDAALQNLKFDNQPNQFILGLSYKF